MNLRKGFEETENDLNQVYSILLLNKRKLKLQQIKATLHL